ncbi:hypothetical protein [Photobacterium phosphoreum]|uniref:hypothetical protein n=1 Tax=Photobacterium phosphoreum TaxID=659 RepID=UPI002431B97F|nr:hypothetical protein [Photobacterium phosphoreum]
MNNIVSGVFYRLYLSSIIGLVIAILIEPAIGYRVVSVFYLISVIVCIPFFCRGFLARKISIFLFIMTFLGIVLGFLNSIYAENNIYSWLIYSALSVIYLFCFVISNNVEIDLNYIHTMVKLFAIAAIVEMSWFFLRVIIFGLNSRSNYGFSFLSPFIALYIKQSAINENMKSYLVFILSLIVVSIGALSGLRSTFVYSMFLSLLCFYIAGFQSAIRSILPVSLITIIAIILFEYDLVNVELSNLTRSLEIIFNRFMLTLFSESGAKLDPNGGRYEEAIYALETFKYNINSFVDVIFGKGYGFEFIDHSKDSQPTAHVHMTPVAYFVRNGVVGVAWFISILVVSIYIVCNVVLLKSKYFDDSIKVMSIILVFWTSSSLFSGMLLNPFYWLLLGFCTRWKGFLRYYDSKKE